MLYDIFTFIRFYQGENIEAAFRLHDFMKSKKAQGNFFDLFLFGWSD